MNEYIDTEWFKPRALPLQETADRVDDQFSRHFDDCSRAGPSYDAYKAQASLALDPVASDIRDWLIDNFPQGPEGFPDERQRSYLAGAFVLLLRAQRAIEEGASEQAWYFLSECKHSIGMADGDYSATRTKYETTKRASSAGRGKQAPVYRAKMRVVHLLKDERPTEGWKTHFQARECIAPKLRGYLAEKGITAIADVDAELLKWLENDGIVAAAYREWQADVSQKRR